MRFHYESHNVGLPWVFLSDKPPYQHTDLKVQRSSTSVGKGKKKSLFSCSRERLFNLAFITLFNFFK